MFMGSRQEHKFSAVTILIISSTFRWFCCGSCDSSISSFKLVSTPNNDKENYIVIWTYRPQFFVGFKNPSGWKNPSVSFRTVIKSMIMKKKKSKNLWRSLSRFSRATTWQLIFTGRSSRATWMSLHIPIQTHGQYISNKPDIVIRDMNDSSAHGFSHSSGK